MLGGDISASATPDAVIVETSALSDKAPEMFALMSEVIRQPNFPSAEVELRRSNMKAELDQARAESDHLALVTFDRKIFKGHPYAAAAAPTDASIARLSRELVLTAYKKIMTPVGAHLIIAGDIQKEAVEKIIADQFGTWSGAEAPADTPAVAAGIGAQRQIYLFDRPKSSQTTLIFGNLAVREDNPAFFDFLVANCILGGFSSSRLNREIREKHGYTYGIWTELDHRLNASVFHVRTSVRTEVTEPAMKAIFNELKKIRLKNPQIEEVDAAKAYLSGKMALRMETQHGIVQAIVHQKIMRLPDDFYDHYVERINAVTLPGIQRAASTFMRPDEMTVAVVGDAQKIRHALAKMSARPLTLVSSDGE
jgi:zinc protease